MPLSFPFLNQCSPSEGKFYKSKPLYISLNEFYEELGLSHTMIGDQLGWNIDKGLIELDFSSQIAEDGTPCLVIDYSIAPKYDFSRLV